MVATFAVNYLSTGFFNWLFSYLFTPISIVVSSFLGFYLYSAVYRAFKARSFDTALFIVAAAFVLLRMAPVGPVIWSGFDVIGSWLLQTPNAAAWNGLIISVSIGSIALGVRNLIGTEKTVTGGGE
jgi:hypothetical protein